MENIKTMLSNPTSFYAKISTDIEYVDKANVKDNINHISTEMRMWKGYYFYENDIASMVINDRWTVGLYHTSKQIIYGRNNPKEMEHVKKIALSKNVPVTFRPNDKIEFVGIENGLKKYVIKTDAPGVSTMEIHIDISTGFLSQIITVYSENPNAVVKKTHTRFSDVSFSKSYSDKDFSESRFISFNEKQQVKPIEKYRLYQVIYVDPTQLKDF